MKSGRARGMEVRGCKGTGSIPAPSVVCVGRKREGGTHTLGTCAEKETVTGWRGDGGTCNPSTWAAQAGGWLRVQGQPGLRGECKASLT